MTDLFGIQNEFNQQPNQMMQNVAVQQSGPKVTLYLFSPRYIPDQWRRPHQYQFGGEFRMDLQANLEKAASRPYNSLDSLMLPNVSARSAILPVTNGYQMDLRNFSQYWTFVMIVDNDTALSPLGTTASMPSRTLYSGYIFDEPVTKTNFGTGYTHNPGAVFTISHHTTLNMMTYQTSNGIYSRPETMEDYDYCSAPVAQAINSNGEQLYDLNPSKVSNSIICGQDSSFQIAPTPALAADRSSVRVPTEMNAPTYHLQNVVHRMADTVKMLAQPGGQDDLFAGDDIVLSTFNTCIGGIDTGLHMSSLNPDKPISFGELDAKFGQNLNVVVLNQPSELQYDITLPSAPTRRNVFTGIISTTLPPMLAQFGLAEIAFRYNSAQAPNGFALTSIERGIYHLENIASLYAGSNEALNMSWNTFQDYLNKILWPVIKANCGDFDVMVHCSLSGVSLVNLQLLDEVSQYGLIENNNLLGGLNTPLVGTHKELASNAAQLYGALHDIGATGTPGIVTQSNALPIW